MAPELFFDCQDGEFFVFDCRNGDFFRAFQHLGFILGEEAISEPPTPGEEVAALQMGLSIKSYSEVFRPFYEYIVNHTEVASVHPERTTSPFLLTWYAWQLTTYHTDDKEPIDPEELPHELHVIVLLLSNLAHMFQRYGRFALAFEGIIDDEGNMLEQLMLWNREAFETEEPVEPSPEVIQEAGRARILLFHTISEDADPFPDLPEA